MTDETANIAALQVEVHHLTDAVHGLEKKVDALTAQANRWRGAFLVIMAVGGLLGGIGTYVAGRWLR